MQISVVIPTLNEESTVERAIASCWAWGAVEVVVVDGGSSDQTRAKSLAAGARVLETAPSRGAQQAHGAAVCQGEVIVFLHADSWLPPSAGEQLRRAFQAESTGITCFRQRIDDARAVYRWLEWGNAGRAVWLGLPYGDQGIAVRRSLLEDCGGFPPAPLMEELVLMRRLRRHAWPILLPGPITVSPRRWQRRGVVRQTLVNWSLLSAYTCGISPSTLRRWYR